MLLIRLPTVLLALALGSPAQAREPAPAPATPPQVAGATFYQDKARGWFWYEEPEPEVVLTPVTPKPVFPQLSVPPQPVKAELPPTGSVAWIRAMLPKLRDKALDEPTQDNVEAYFYAQRIMLDKAERFSRHSVEVIRNDPFLDEDLRYPASNAASDALATAAGKQKEVLMKMIAGHAALLFFYKGNDCILCEQALAAIAALEFRYGFAVKPVSLDGASLPGGKYPNTQYDNGLAEHLGIVTTPAIALVIPPEQVRVVSFSTVSMETATSRILLAARDAGLITEREYQGTSRLNTMGLIDASQLADAPPDVTQAPEVLVARMRDEARRAFQLDSGGGP